MESANLHHHRQYHQQQQQQQQLQDHELVVGVNGSSLPWPPNTTLNPSNNNLSTSPNIGNISRQQNDYIAPSLTNTSMNIQDLGFHQWASSSINGDMLANSYQKFTEMMIQSSPSSSITQDFHFQQQQQQQQQQPSSISYMKNEEREYLNNEMMSEKLLLRNFSSGCQIKGLQFQGATDHSRRGSFSQIFPTINISNLNPPPLHHQSSSCSSSNISSSSLDMNMQPLDLMKNEYLNQASSTDNLGVYYGVNHLQQSSHRPSKSTINKISSAFTSGVSEAKRPSSFMERKVPQSAQKKSRSDSRASCPPIKVRKEKLGDRIAALQQLVAPFGKTDTASVLMEAIGYIKFLQNQVETLSVPYMKSSRNRISTKTTRGGSVEDGNEELRRDLKSRGLCLVPLSCMSYVTDGGGGVWPPPNFG